MRSARLVSNLWLALSSTTTRPTTKINTTNNNKNSIFAPGGHHHSKAKASRWTSGFATALGSAKSCANANDMVEEDSTDENDAIRRLSGYHPIVIEGMGYYDPRDPSVVAKNLCRSLQSHLEERGSGESSSNSRPYLVVVQGDPPSERGISAITPLVAECLGLERGLVCLDARIDPTHSQNADRENVVLEVTYSQLARVLDGEAESCTGSESQSESESQSVLQTLEDSVDALIARKNDERTKLGKPPMKEYFKQYAMLQEVTKASLRRLCGDRLTIAHTSADINPFSVTSFYEVGLTLGLYHRGTDMVAYRNHDGDEEFLDFDAIDTR